jgi:hypothetical protein
MVLFAPDDELPELLDGLLVQHDEGGVRLHEGDVRLDEGDVRLHEGVDRLMRSGGRKTRDQASVSDSLDKVDKEVSQQ